MIHGKQARKSCVCFNWLLLSCDMTLFLHCSTWPNILFFAYHCNGLTCLFVSMMVVCFALVIDAVAVFYIFCGLEDCHLIHFLDHRWVTGSLGRGSMSEWNICCLQGALRNSVSGRRRMMN